MQNLKRLGWLAGWLMVGTVSAAEIGDIRFNVTDHLIFSNAEELDGSQRTNLFLHEDTVRGEVGNYTLGINFTNRFTPDGDSDTNKPFNLEKKIAVGEWENWKVELGDSHQELGRGIALSLYRDTVFGIDNTLEGASATFRPTGLETGVFAGRINPLKSPVAINPFRPSLSDSKADLWMAGASVKGDVVSGTKVGGHYFLALNRPLDATRFDKRWDTAGVLVQSEITDGVDTYGETNVLLTQALGDSIQQLPAGYGSYGSVAWTPAPWTVKLEGKDYRQYRWEFRRPPTLEEDIIESINTQDVSALRLYGEHKSPESRLAIHGSYLIGDDRIQNNTVHHVVGGTKFRGPLRIDYEVRTGYRWFPGSSRLAHGIVKGKIPTFTGQSFELEFRKQIEDTGLATGTSARTERNVVGIGYNFSEKLNVSSGYEYVPFNSSEEGRHFFNTGASYKVGALAARGFVGKTSGGTVCSGGVCRQVPPYTGAMVETTYTF